MIVLQLSQDEAETLACSLCDAPSAGVLVAWDPIDRAVKVKATGRWSPPLGTVIADD